jgi:3-oxoacyl-[acyl-carrier-protein] synthase III
VLESSQELANSKLQAVRTQQGATIGSLGSAVPPTVVDNSQIAERLGVNEGWIESRTGIAKRHVLQPDETLADLAAQAARRCIERAEIDPSSLDLVLVGTTSNEYVTPNVAPKVAQLVGATRAGCMDIGAACTAFLSAVSAAAGQIEAGRANNALVIGADALFKYLNLDDKRTAGVFGDGAGAALMTATEPPGRVGPVSLRADGSQSDLIYATVEEPKIYMAGHETFKNAVARLSEVTEQALALSGFELEDIDWFCYHQANGRILTAVGEQLRLPGDRVLDYIESFGNTSAASIPLALATAESEGRLAEGQRLLLAAFGAGFTWGGMVVEWGNNDQ